MILSRLHPIAEAVRSRPREIEFVLFDSNRRDRRINELKALCRQGGVPTRYGDHRALERLGGPDHQGAVARLAARGYLPEEEASSLQIRSGWGPLYDFEQLFEHAIVHVLRHRRQIERFLGR